MQLGPYLHPATGMFGAWSLRILITNRSVFPADFLHWTDCHLERFAVPPDTPGLPAYGQMFTVPLPAREAACSYLRTVIVTAAVYRGFSSSLAALPLTFRHRAGVSPYTSPYGFAETCVFSKQSVGPLNCNPQLLWRLTPTQPKAPLLPKLRGYFAEFLRQSSLDRLGILFPSTSVGLRYGHLHSS